MLEVPSNDTPPIVLAVAKEVAVPALPEASPVNDVAVTMPEKVAFPLAAIVAAVPTFNLVTVIVGLPVNPAEVPEVF